VAWRGVAWRGVALTILVFGCERSAPEVDLSTILGNRDVGVESLASDQEHDLGTILAQGQSLSYEFTVRNATERPIRLLRGTALTPCCSAVGPLPELIPPMGETKIPVIFKPGYHSGAKRVAFTVETDDKERPTRDFALRGQLVSAWQLEALNGPSISLQIGESAKQAFRMTSRRVNGQGCGLPETISATPPLNVAYQGDVSTTTGAGGLIEATRDVLVTIPPENRIGPWRGDVVFGWTDGRSETRSISWEVRPRLRVSPPGFVLHSYPTPLKRTVHVVSDGRPFRITKVSSPLLTETVGLPQEARTRQELMLSLDVSQATPGLAMDVAIHTDDPAHATLSLSVMVLRDHDEAVTRDLTDSSSSVEADRVHFGPD
jgi:hypothetical protein